MISFSSPSVDPFQPTGLLGPPSFLSNKIIKKIGMRKHSCKAEKAEMPLFSLASSQDTREELKLFVFFNPSALEIKSPQTKAAHKDDPGASGQGLSQTNQSRSSLLSPTEYKLHSAFFWPLGGISIQVSKTCVQTEKARAPGLDSLNRVQTTTAGIENTSGHVSKRSLQQNTDTRVTLAL